MKCISQVERSLEQYSYLKTAIYLFQQVLQMCNSPSSYKPMGTAGYSQFPIRLTLPIFTPDRRRVPAGRKDGTWGNMSVTSCLGNAHCAANCAMLFERPDAGRRRARQGLWISRGRPHRTEILWGLRPVQNVFCGGFPHAMRTLMRVGSRLTTA